MNLKVKNMNDILESKLTIFKMWTVELLQRLQLEEYEDEAIEECFVKRQHCIDDINELVYESKQFTDIATQLGLLDLEKQLDYKMKEKHTKLKEKIDEVSRTKSANKNYNRNVHRNYSFFNTKV
jgi:hypothetical protein